MSLPRPYYQDERVTLYCADLRDVVADLPKADLVLTDPPYEETSCQWDCWPQGWPLWMVGLAPAMWCFGSLKMFMERASEFSSWQFSQDIVWERHNGSSLHPDRFRRVHELAALFYCGDWSAIYKEPQREPSEDIRQHTLQRSRKPTHFGQVDRGPAYSYDGSRLQRSVIRCRSTHGRAVHPTQKPDAIVAPLLAYSCPVGGMVLDPFAGSGTTLVEAKRTGRYAIGVEGVEVHCRSAVERLKQEFLPLEAV